MTHLWFFVGILAGAAVRSPLDYIASALKHRRELKLVPTVFVWQLFLIMLLIEFWVASIAVSSIDMGLGQFLLFLLLPFGAMILASLSKPSFEPGVDQLAEFESERTVFFIILAALPVISLLREIVAGESIPFDSDLVFRILVFVGALLGLVIRSRKVAFIHGVAMLVLISTYLFSVYAEVPA